MIDITGKKITIIGAQRSGEALAKLVLQHGGDPRISDISSHNNVSQKFLIWLKKNSCVYELGEHTRSFIEDSDFLVLSPGVPFQSDPVQWAKELDIPVIGEIEFSFQFCTTPIISVTGSNGKTTVVTLIHKMLMEAGYTSSLCGNVGIPFSARVLNANQKDYVVLELSSFQLEVVMEKSSQLLNQKDKFGAFKYFCPYIAILLNCTQNHLDRHKDFDDYLQAKLKMFLHQDKNCYSVFNFQDSMLKDFIKNLKSKVEYFNQPLKNDEWSNPNYSAVRKVGDLLGISQEVTERVFKNFKGVEHRTEWIRSYNEVDYVNDSKATTVEAGRWAIRNISQPIVLICGGKDKNIEFDSLIPDVKNKVKKMIIFGESKQKIYDVFFENVSCEKVVNLKEAIQSAQQVANTGDCIVLSPMCASFDMFKNYEDRGQQFKELVRSLK